MKVELLVSEWCASCHQAEKVWREVAEEREFDFSVLDMGQPEGKALVSRLRLKTIPAVVVDGELKGIGVQSLQEARALVGAAPPRQKTTVQHAGLSLSVDNRWFIIGAMVYLMLSGLGLVINGSFLSDGPARPVAMHLFAVGFMVFMIFGLGAHMLPRFTGNPIRMGAWPWVQMGFAHVGLAGYTLGFLLQIRPVAALGGVCIWAAPALFTFRIWPVLWPKREAQGGGNGIS